MYFHFGCCLSVCMLKKLKPNTEIFTWKKLKESSIKKIKKWWNILIKN